MGFLDAIFHAAAISAIEANREVRQDERRARDRFNNCVAVEDSLNALLKRTGSPASYISNTQKAEAEISKMNRWTREYEEYLSLGGHAKGVEWIEDIDDELQFIKALSAMGKLSEQDRFRDERNRLRIFTDTARDDSLACWWSKQTVVDDLINFHGFNEREALWLLSQCDTDWNLYARRDASGYLESCHIESKEKLIDYLLSDGFTKEQVQQAADYCWKD